MLHLGISHAAVVMIVGLIVVAFSQATSGYHLNLKSANPRPSRPNNTFTFGAADDAAAEAVAAEIANWTADQQVSLTKNLVNDILSYGGGAYPAGTRNSLNALIEDSSGGVWRVRLRNVVGGISNASWANLFLGVADVATGFSGLVAPPTLPNSGNAVAVVVSTGVVTKG